MLLYLPVPLVQFLVHVFVCLENAGEVHGGGHGATAPVLAPGRPSATAEPRRAHNRWMEDLRSRTEDTHSGGISFKSPRIFVIFNPRSLAH